MENENRENDFGGGSDQNGQPTSNGQQFGNQNTYTGGQQYVNQNTYTSGSQFGNQNYSQNYGNQNYVQNYGNQGYGAYGYGMDSVPLGSNGKPLQNRFGMKMTFSILEILCCCGCNIITMVLGIISCVFTSKANRAYKEHRWDDFKSSATTSAVCLWVGFGVAVLYLIFGIVEWTVGGGREIFYDAYQEAFEEAYGGYTYNFDDIYNFDIDDFNTDDDGAISILPDSDADTDTDENEIEIETETEEIAFHEPLEIIPGDSFDDPTITLNDVTFTLPLGYVDLEALGLSIREDYKSETLDGASGILFHYVSVDVSDANGTKVGSVDIANMSEEDITIEQGIVIGVSLTSRILENEDVSLSLPSGINKWATYEDCVTAYGEPDDTYQGDDYMTYTWRFHNPDYRDSSNNSVKFSFKDDGSFSRFILSYSGWDY